MNAETLARFKRRERLHALVWARLRVGPATMAELGAVITAVPARELRCAVYQLRHWNWIVFVGGRWQTSTPQ